MLDAIDTERLGKPTLTIIEEKFERAARLAARMGALPAIPLLVEPTPGTPGFDPAGFVAERWNLITAAFLEAPAE